MYIEKLRFKGYIKLLLRRLKGKKCLRKKPCFQQKTMKYVQI